MGCGVAQRQQRRKKFQIFLGSRSLNRLRLVNYQNRVCFGDDVDWATGAEIIKFSEYNCCIFIRSFAAFQLFIRINRFVECLHIDDHDIDGAVRRKAVNFRKLCGVVDEETNLLAVFLCKMLLRHLKRFIDALADGNARHDHDEFAPTIVLVQFIHGLDVGISLTDAGFHFNRQIIATFQLVRRLDLIGTLYLLQMLQNQLVGKLRHNTLVAPAGEIRIILQANLIVSITAVHHICRREVRLSGKDVNDRFCRIRLKFLVFELQFQSSSPPVSSSIHSCSFFCRSFLSGKYN